ncbi:unnamed protein product [Caenorhabditis brenneri]
MQQSRYNAKFQRNFVQNLLEREIGTDYQKHGTAQNTYRHRHQLLTSVKPNFVTHINLDYCEAPNPDLPPFSSRVRCLGFSPNGRFLAFHSHGLGSISLINYTGVEGAKTRRPTVRPSNIFQEISKFSLSRISRDVDYSEVPIIGSWWTDDSTTLIVQLAMEPHEDADQGEARIPNLNNPQGVQQRRRDAGSAQSFELQQNTVNHPIADRHDGDSEEMEGLPISPNEGNIQRFFEHSNPDVDILDNAVQNGQTSRTIPFLSAIQTSINVALNQVRKTEETSRTMPVYHAVVSSILQKDDSATKQEEIDCTQPSTSNSNTMSFADQLRNIIGSSQQKDRVSNQNDVDILKELQDLMKEDPRIARKFNKSGTSIRLGYSRDRNGRHSSSQFSRSRFPDSKEFRDMLHNPDRPTHIDIENLKADDNEMMVAFLAINTESNTVAPLYVHEVQLKFRCHIRDRILSFTYNSETVETYQLTRANNWERMDFHLALKASDTVQLHYRAETMPGHASRLREVETSEVFPEIYLPSKFMSPIQQDVAVMLFRDMKEWIQSYEDLMIYEYSVSRCHMITDNLLAISGKLMMSSVDSPPVQLGIIVSLQNMALTLYPDYHQFLKLLFRNHLPDLLPRHWTYLNPTPVNEQRWFLEEFIDVSDKKQLNKFERLNDIYEFLVRNWTNVKSTSNPLTDSAFFNVGLPSFLGDTLYACDENASHYKHCGKCTKVNMELYYHPTDPFIFVKSYSDYMVAIRRKDPDDVIIHNN